MSIVLHCDLCGFEVEDTNNVVLELQHWLIIKHPTGGEEHFCKKCKPGMEKDIDEMREAAAQRQENE